MAAHRRSYRDLEEARESYQEQQARKRARAAKKRQAAGKRRAQGKLVHVRGYCRGFARRFRTSKDTPF